jgi:hypothetical protein
MISVSTVAVVQGVLIMLLTKREFTDEIARRIATHKKRIAARFLDPDQSARVTRMTELILLTAATSAPDVVDQLWEQWGTND